MPLTTLAKLQFLTLPFNKINGLQAVFKESYNKKGASALFFIAFNKVLVYIVMLQIINNSMKHFIYKTTHKNGKYYIGRHSTDNLNDGYIGSGKWVSQIKQKEDLQREILEFVDSFELLVQKENEYLTEHYGKPNCMNMSNTGTGAATGDANPMKQDKVRAKFQGDKHWTAKYPNRVESISGDNHWMKVNVDAKEKFLENHPNLDGRNAKLAYAKGTHISITNNPSTVNAKNGTHHWQHGKSPNHDGKLNKKLVAEGTHNFLGSDLNDKRVAEGTHNFLGSDANLKRLAEGTHPSQKKQTCEHCTKTVSIGMYKRWHGTNCKKKNDLA